ncbi:MAG: polyphosphate polymerase domain-containing protein [Oscillospiraceae bacterium]|nr:polyphosphate polymerase domain-containing protein [Oscillospiraceae bacterium]
MENDIFQRYEIKFMLDSRQRAVVEQAFAEHMLPDPHGESTICNVYYDTPDYRLVRQSLEKPVYKEKLRMRSYGRANANSEVFLELKKKYDGVVYKRRISLKEHEAAAYMAGWAPLPEDSQIGREIEYFRRFYRALRPAVYLCYDRSAYFSKEDPELRATFDKNICWRKTAMQLTAAPGGEHLLLPRHSLFEVKTAGTIPLWLVEVLDAAEIRQASFSKYGEAYKTICERADKERQGVTCA